MRLEDFQALRPFLRPYTFTQHSTLQEQGRRIDYIDFIEAGLVSFRTLALESVMEFGTAGRQGVSGASVILGGRYAVHQSRALIGGRTLRIEVESLLRLTELRPTIRDTLLAYVEALMIHGSQLALCKACHPNDARLATWMCVASDWSSSAALPVTHQHLSTSLALRRATVTESLSGFEAGGLIRKMRGAVEIVDRGRLEAVACGCYRVIASGYKGRFGLEREAFA
jgi:CRP-like cAMP-binding protein